MPVLHNLMGPDEVVVDAGRLRELVYRVLRIYGAVHDDADSQARVLVEGDLRNQHSHGVRRLPVLVGRLREGLLVSGKDPDLFWTTDVVLAVDGGRGFGPAVANIAVDAISERAETEGIALAAVTNSNHVGMLAPYVERMAARGQIGLAFTTSEALVHAWGGAKAMVGTNPIGIAVPTADEPLVLDMSTASVSMGKVLDHAAKGLPIPLGWAVDADGAPTRDAAAAVQGAISPFGGAKGYALGVALEAFVAVLTGSALGRSVRGTLDIESICSKGDVFLAVSLDRLGLAGMLPLLSAYLDDVRASAVDPVMPILIPGDRAREVRAARLEHGIPLQPEVWKMIRELAGDDDE